MSTQIENATVQLTGGSFHYRRAGSPELPPLILLHALTADSTSWDAVIGALSARFRVLALDQRGHGRSPRAADYSFAAMRDDATEFADALGIERFHLIGHSMGATVAFLAAQSIPKRIETLIIEDTVPPWVGAELPELPPSPPAGISYDWQAVRQYFAQLSEPDPLWWERLPAITAPTLIIGGGTTSPVPQDRLCEAAKRVGNAKLLTIQGAGHHVHATRLPEFLAAVQAFLP